MLCLGLVACVLFAWFLDGLSRVFDGLTVDSCLMCIRFDYA